MNIILEFHYLYAFWFGTHPLNSCVYLRVNFVAFCQIKFKSNLVEPTIQCISVQSFAARISHPLWKRGCVIVSL
jgi:hypothetical protein